MSDRCQGCAALLSPEFSQSLQCVVFYAHGVLSRNRDHWALSFIVSATNRRFSRDEAAYRFDQLLKLVWLAQEYIVAGALLTHS